MEGIPLTDLFKDIIAFAALTSFIAALCFWAELTSTLIIVGRVVV